MKYFFDNCISFRLVNMLKALDVDAVHLTEEFAANVKDVPLFRALHGRNVVYISADTSQLTREMEAAALRRAEVTALYLGPFWPKLQRWPQAAWLVRHWPKIDKFANDVEQGTCAELRQQAKPMIYRV